MTPRRALQAILLVSLAGASFAGTLTYREMFTGAAPGCTAGGTPGTLLGLPFCLYGLAMFAVLAALAALGLARGRASSGAGEFPPATPRTAAPGALGSHAPGRRAPEP